MLPGEQLGPLRGVSAGEADAVSGLGVVQDIDGVAVAHNAAQQYGAAGWRSGQAMRARSGSVPRRRHGLGQQA